MTILVDSALAYSVLVTVGAIALLALIVSGIVGWWRR